MTARFMFTDAVDRVACSRCGSGKGTGCVQPSGRKTTEPHSERMSALAALPDFNPDDYRVPMLKPDDVVAAIVSGKGAPPGLDGLSNEALQPYVDALKAAHATGTGAVMFDPSTGKHTAVAMSGRRMGKTLAAAAGGGIAMPSEEALAARATPADREALNRALNTIADNAALAANPILQVREGAGLNAPKAAVTPHVMKVDRWGARRGQEIAEAWANPMAPSKVGYCARCDSDPCECEAAPLPAIHHDPVVIADAHAALFEYEPKLAEQPADQGRAVWWKQLMDTPEFASLRSKTMLDTGLSELGSKSLCDQWVAYVAENPECKPNESIGDTMKRMSSTSKALNQAFEDVATAQDAAAGLGLGDKDGQINPKDLVSYFNRVKDDEFLRQLMKIAGRMRTLAQTLQRTKTLHGRDDTVGVELGGDIARLVPSELGQLASGVPELELLALDRVARGQAMCRKYRAKEQLGKGPIVVVVDESGSMGGDPIMTAKALALALAWVARQQRRWIAMVGFSGGEVGNWVAFPPGQMDQDKLIDWLTHFYSGGTTLDVPLHELPFVYWPAFMQMGLQRGRTDVVLITDAEVNAPAEMIQKYIVWAKDEQVRTYGIIIGQDDAGDIAQFATRHWCVPDLGNADAAIETLLSI